MEPKYTIEEGRGFRSTVDQFCQGIPRFEERLDALKFELERDPRGVGHLIRKVHDRYVAVLTIGTLDWRVLVDYQIQEETIILIQIIPPPTHQE